MPSELPKLNDLSRRDLMKLTGLLASSFMFANPLPHIDPRARQEQERSLSTRTQGGGAAEGPNVLILVFDALSARNMSLYGYHRQTTPNLSRIADRATVYHRHHAGGSFTTPGVASMLTGTHLWAHRALNQYGTVSRSFQKKNIFNQIAGTDYFRMAYTQNELAYLLLTQFQDSIDLFPEMRALGISDRRLLPYALENDKVTATWSELLLFNYLTQPTTILLGLADRLRHWLDDRALEERFGEEWPNGIPFLERFRFRLEEVMDWMLSRALDISSPYLAYVHLLPPHDPYITRGDFIGLFNDGWQPVAKGPHLFSQGYQADDLLNRRRKYDEFIAYVDSEAGRLIDSMRLAGLLENTWVIITSDHGEMFERGIWQHLTPTLFEPVLHVPLLILKPGQDRRVDVDQLTSSVDLMPTILHILDEAIPSWCEGEILPGMTSITPKRDRAIYALDAKSNDKYRALNKYSMALYRGHHKLIGYFGYDRVAERYELYDLETDPEELVDLSVQERSLMNLMKEQMLDAVMEADVFRSDEKS